MVTHQLQVERRTAKGHRPKTDALPLDHTTNLVWDKVFTEVPGCMASFKAETVTAVI